MLIFSAIVSFGAVAALFIKFPFCFSSNDDVLLREILSGNYTATPDAHAIYIMYPLGLIFKGLYGIFAGVPWYGGFMSAVHALCVFLIVFRLQSQFKGIINRILACVVTLSIVVLLDAKYLIMHQYTALSGLVAATAILWIATFKFKEKYVKLQMTIIIILLTVSMWLRFQVFLLSLPFVMLATIVNYVDDSETYDSKYEKAFKSILPLGVLVLVIGVSMLSEFLAYKSPEWQEFKEYNETRTEVYDYDKLINFDTNAEYLENIGITKEAHGVLSEQDILFVGECGAEEFKMIAAKNDEIMSQWQQFYSVPRKVIVDTVKNFAAECGKLPGIVVTCMFFGTLFILYYNDHKWTALIVLASYAYMWAALGWLTYKGRVVDRVTYGLLMMEILFLTGILIASISKSTRERSTSPFWAIIMTLIYLGLTSITGLYTYRTVSDEYSETMSRITAWEELNAYFKQNPNCVYLLDTAVYANFPERLLTENVESFNVIRLGNWTANSPLQTKREQRILTDTIKNSYVGGENVFFVQQEGRSYEFLQAYLEKEGVELQKALTVAVSDGTKYNLIKAVRNDLS